MCLGLLLAKYLTPIASYFSCCRVGIVDCVTYPFIVYSHQCQLYPYYTVGPSLMAPFRTLIVMNNMVHLQVGEGGRGTPYNTETLVTPFL